MTTPTCQIAPSATDVTFELFVDGETITVKVDRRTKVAYVVSDNEVAVERAKQLRYRNPDNFWLYI